LKATLGICGEPVVGRALTLLLRGSGYAARFLLAQSLVEPRALAEDVRLMVLAPTPGLSAERRDALVRSLEEVSEARSVPVLELVTPGEARRREGAESESWHTVPWPCRIEELERRIEAALVRRYGTRGEGNDNPTDAAVRL
jgi:DNA-binding response OmpR family regulator